MGKKPLVGLLGLGVLSLALAGCKDCKTCGGSRNDTSPYARRTTTTSQQVAGGQTPRPRTVPDGTIAGKTNEQPEVRPVTQPQRLVRDTHVPVERPTPAAKSFDRPAPLTRVDGAGQPVTNLKGTHESSEDVTPVHKHPATEVHEIPSSAPAMKKFEEAPVTPVKGPDIDKMPPLPGKVPAREIESMPNPAQVPQIKRESLPAPELKPVPPVEAAPSKVGTKPNPLPPEAPALEVPTIVPEPAPMLAPTATAPKAGPEAVVPPPPVGEVTPPVVQPTGKGAPAPTPDLVPPVPVPPPGM